MFGETLRKGTGNSLKYQGSFSTEMKSSRKKWPVPMELCRWTRTILCVKNELALPGTQQRWENPCVLEQSSPALGMELVSTLCSPQPQSGCTQTASALPFQVPECRAIRGEHRLLLERQSSLKHLLGAGGGLAGELGAQGGVRYSERCPLSAAGAPVLNTLAGGECFFKAAAAILGCLTTQTWWQCHMFGI